MAEFVMPALGADMSAGTLIAWRKQPGDAGRPRRHHRRGPDRQGRHRGRGVHERRDREAARRARAEGSRRARRSRIIRETGKRRLPLGRGTAARGREPAAAAPAGAGPRIVASPSAKSARRASSASTWRASRGIGPGRTHPAPRRRGRPRRPRAAAAGAGRPAPRTGPGPRKARTGRRAMRRAIAAAMARSKREIPHFYLARDDRPEPRDRAGSRRRTTAIGQDRLLHGVLLLKAVALALREVPELNAIWQDGQRRARATPSTSASRSPCAAAASSLRPCTTPTGSASTS